MPCHECNSDVELAERDERIADLILQRDDAAHEAIRSQALGNENYRRLMDASKRAELAEARVKELEAELSAWGDDEKLNAAAFESMQSKYLLDAAHLAALISAAEPFAKAMSGKRPPNTEEWNALTAAVDQAKQVQP